MCAQWSPDILGAPFEATEISLRPGRGRPVSATLVRSPTSGNRVGAVLWVHGWADYFFQRHLAEHLNERGYDFYAVDLRRYGRSLREDDQPNAVTDLAEYFEELDAARALIRADSPGRLVLIGHSTGGLILSLWADARREDPVADAMVLNSPWFDLAASWLRKTVATRLVNLLGRLRPDLRLPAALSPVYGHSLLSRFHGEWEFNEAWKPTGGFPVRAGWLRAIRRGHARLHRGLDVPMPVLVLHSERSARGASWTPEHSRADTVLNVSDMVKFAPKVGRRVETVAVSDGLHDLFLSARPARDRAFAALDSWLDRTFPTTP